MGSERWAIFGLLFAVRTAIAYQFQSLASVGPLLVDMLPIGFVELNSLIGIYMLPGVVVAYPGGLVDQRLGAKRTMALSLSLMLAGAALMSPGTTALLFSGRLVSGAGAAILNVVLARAVATWFSGEQLSGIMGLFVVSWPLGIALSLLSVPGVTVAFGWRALILAAAIPCLVCLVLIPMKYREPDRNLPVNQAGTPSALTGSEIARTSIAGLAWGFYNVSYVVFVASMPEFLVQLGYSLTAGAAFTSILGWSMILTLPVGGYLSQTLSRPGAATCSCLLVVAVAATCLVLTPATLPSLAILAVAIGLPAGFILALPARILARGKRSTGMGIFFTIFYLLMAIVPSGAGLVRQYFGAVSSSVLFGAVVVLLACLSVLLLLAKESKGAPAASG